MKFPVFRRIDETLLLTKKRSLNVLNTFHNVVKIKKLENLYLLLLQAALKIQGVTRTHCAKLFPFVYGH